MCAKCQGGSATELQSPLPNDAQVEVCVCGEVKAGAVAVGVLLGEQIECFGCWDRRICPDADRGLGTRRSLVVFPSAYLSWLERARVASQCCLGHCDCVVACQPFLLYRSHHQDAQAAQKLYYEKLADEASTSALHIRCKCFPRLLLSVS